MRREQRFSDDTSLDISRRDAVRTAGVGLVSVTIAGLLGGCSKSASSTNSPDDTINRTENLGFAGRVISQPLKKPSQIFTDTSGADYDIGRQTDGRLTLLFFGYTSCPDVCPVHLGIITAARRQMSGEAAKAKVIFVGVDTARDTPKKMRSYLDSYDRDYVGLTAEPSVIAQAVDGLGLPPTVIGTPGPDGSYSVGHASQVLVYGRDNRSHIQYPFGTRTQDWVADLPRIIDFDWPTS